MKHYEKSLSGSNGVRKVSAKAGVQKTFVSKKKTVTDRFVQAMQTIISSGKINRGDIRNVRAFADSMGYSSSNFSKFYGKSKREVSLDLVEKICRIHNVNPSWLIIGTGEMFLNEDNSLEKRVMRLERLVGRNS